MSDAPDIPPAHQDPAITAALDQAAAAAAELRAHMPELTDERRDRIRRRVEEGLAELFPEEKSDT